MYVKRVFPSCGIFPSVAIVPDGAGKGTAESQNGKRAAEYLKTVESLVVPGPPFSWVLIRPPLATDCVCCKACVCHKMKLHCTTSSPEVCVCACVHVCRMWWTKYLLHECSKCLWFCTLMVSFSFLSQFVVLVIVRNEGLPWALQLTLTSKEQEKRWFSLTYIYLSLSKWMSLVAGGSITHSSSFYFLLSGWRKFVNTFVEFSV